jgi:hypothetical protein
MADHLVAEEEEEVIVDTTEGEAMVLVAGEGTEEAEEG